MTLTKEKNPYLPQGAVRMVALIVAVAATAMQFLPPGSPQHQWASFVVALGSAIGIVSPGAVRR